jgi:cysteine-rich repeat protein
VVAIDLDSVFAGAFAAGALRFDAVQLTDDTTQGAHSGDQVGPDIDAAGAIASDAIVCGDQRVEGGEACDDGDILSGDGCSTTCRVETCWRCSGEPSLCAVDAGGPCDDGEPCTTGDVCGGPSGLTCVGGPPPACTDDNECTDDECVPGQGCTFVPNSAVCDDGSTCSIDERCVGGACVGTADEGIGCRRSLGGTQLRVLNRLDDDLDAFVWTWPNGDATSLPDFADPLTAGGAYELCIFDGSSQRRLRVAARAEKGQSCAARDCWRVKGARAYLYKNPAAPYGMRQLLLKSGAMGKTKLLAKGRGPALRVGDDASMEFPVRVELRDTETGSCWEAEYRDASRNEGDRFKAKH